jgi:hypothetical protein
MYHYPLTPAAITELSRALGSIFHNHPGLFDELMRRKEDARESALMDVNEFLFSNASTMTVGDRLAIIDNALVLAEKAKSTTKGNVIHLPRVRFEKPKD